MAVVKRTVRSPAIDHVLVSNLNNSSRLQPGPKIAGPTAIEILDGPVTSTSLDLLVLTMLALRYCKFDRRVEE